METKIERKVTNVEIKRSMEPIGVGSTGMYLVPNTNDEYYKLVFGECLLTDGIVNEENAKQWAMDNLLEIMPIIAYEVCKINLMIRDEEKNQPLEQNDIDA